MSGPVNGNGTKPSAVKRLRTMSHQALVALGARTHDRAFTGPLYVQVGVVNSCNYRCTFCWDQPSFVPKHAPYTDKISEEYYTQHPEIDRNKAHMDYDMFTGMVDDLHAMGTRKMKFIGRGESFLHKRFMEMVAYAKARDFIISITTNGALIKDAEARRLVELGVDEMYISVNAGTAKTYNRIHMNTPPEAFGNVKRTIGMITAAKREMGSHRPFINVSFVIQNDNYFEMEDMVRTAHEVGAEKAHFIGISTYEGTKFLALNEEQKEDMPRCLERAVTLADQYGIQTNAEYFLSRARGYKGTKDVYANVPCYIGWFFSIILADGTVNPCCECLRALGTLKTHRFKEVWFGEAYRRFRAENTMLPFSEKEIPGCRCHDCGFALHNLAMHRVLHPISSRQIKQTTYGFDDLKRFTSATH
ncbi:MAG: radical SAM protein [Phycisphaerales bacterium]|nr:radical SAM protein [Phycisphaerales bacterium]